MNAKVETEDYPLNWLRWLVVAVVVTAGIAANSYYSEVGLLFRVAGLLVMAIIAFTVAIHTSQGAAVWAIVKESLTEIRKVVWPSVQETHQTALIVILLTLLMGVILWALDTFFGWLASLIIG